VVDELDQIDPPNPNIADLEDPTLDQLLQQLEREPDLNILLGLPNRPQNLRIISDFLVSTDGNVSVPTALAQAAERARKRAKEESEEAGRLRRQIDQDDDKTEEEWRQVADADEAREKLQKKIDELKQRADDSKNNPDEAAKLRHMAEQLEEMRQQLARHAIDKHQWEEMIRSDQMQSILRAAARGEALPDTQWNRLMSSLGDGLWQGRRREPPENYRRAIEQYQERLRKLINLEMSDVAP
jgi:chromosome segregation ATPase